MSNESYEGPERIAVVGMACRFPGAPDVETFWRNLRAGVDSVSRFTGAELLEAGNDPEILRHPDFVPASGHLEGADLFDAEFFDFPPRDAELMDPQHRLFLEQAWAALEHAGLDPGTFPGPVGVFAGSGMNSYLLHLVARHGNRGDLLLNRIRSDKDFLATLASYKLDLRGPSMSVQTACSTSLVAVHLACQSLLDFHCDAALAGGVAVGAPLRAGYLAREGVFSRDGRCRAFDAAGEGTVGGSGVGVVVLKRLSDALADGDRVHAVILGSAVNNDGAAKVGYSAPGVDGQVEVVAMAQAVADVPPESITLLEAHGTATPMGDPVEVTALARAFATEERGFCALGSVKTNIGHLDAAAGVASLIKAVLALEHGEIPASLHFSEPNPRLDLENTPFYVADRLLPWTPPEGTPRRAGVSAFGVGGTNAHVVLEEAPRPEPAPAADGPELLVLSARTPAALDRLAAATAERLEADPGLPPGDVAFTLRRGRRAFPWRRTLVAEGTAEAAALVRGGDATRVSTHLASESDPGVAFLFSGLGTQYPGMARGLYEGEPAFRRAMDRCFGLLRDGWGMDLRGALYGGAAAAPAPSAGGPDLRALLRGGGSPEGPLAGARLGHPAMFAVGWSLAEAWRARGVEPRAVAGHSLGEYVAACVAGVFSLEDALALVVRRAELLEPVAGRMAAATLSEAETRALLDELAREGHRAWLAAVNAPRSCVVAGSADAVARFGERARAAGAAVLPLAVRHPFHSGLLEPLREPFRHAVGAVRRRAPEVPLATGVDGGWLRGDRAQSVEHWVEHLVAPVRFAECVDTLRGLGAGPEDEPVLLEVGPGSTLGSWARQQGAKRVAACLRHAEQPGSDRTVLLGALGQLWGWGVPVDWKRQGDAEGRRRVVLPGHPLDRKRFWLDISPRSDGGAGAGWGRASTDPVAEGALSGQRAVVFGGADAAALADRLRAAGADGVHVEPGDSFRAEAGSFTVRPASAEDHARLAEALRARGWDGPVLTVHLPPPEGGAGESALAALDEGLDTGVRGLVRWVRGAAGAGFLGEGSALLAVARRSDGSAGAWRAMLGAVLAAVEREHPAVRVRGVDVEAEGWEEAAVAEVARLCGGGGTADRGELYERPGSAAPYVAPRGPLEAAVAELFGRALGIARVGADDGFFELGGDSLVATQLLAAVNERFRVDLPLRTLFASPTPARLAEAVARERSAEAGADPVGGAPVERIPRREETGPAPLSFAQQRIWLHDRLDPDAKLFHVPVTLRLRGELDRAALRRALDEIVRRHEVLRTVFELRDDGPEQVVLPADGVPFAEADAGGGPDAAERALGLAREAAARPFDLEREPAFRATLVRVDGGEHLLVLAMHHIVQDRWASGILLDELAALYTAFARGERSPLPEPELQYADYAAWQRERLTGEAIDGLLDFWRRHLEDAPESLDVPADLPRRPGSFRVGIHPVRFPAATVRGLRALAAEGGGTLYMAFLAAYLVLLRRWSGQDDLVVGSNVGGRIRTETERLMGSFANTLALRFRGSAAGTFRELFAVVRETVLEAHRHQELPFDRLIEELQPAREAGRIPLVHASLDLHRAPATQLEVPGLEVEALPVQVGGAGVDLHWFLEEADGEVRGALEFDARLFLPETAARLADAYLRLLAAAAADPGAPLACLDPLSPAERERVLVGSNDTARDYPRGVCVHDLFRAAAERDPAAVAVSHRGEATTYGELARRSARLAHALRRRGVGPESRVGVCLERTPGLVAAMLGVLQAGGAYVPLDPAYPRERLAHMAEDAEVSLVLTSAALAGVLPPGTVALVLDDVERGAAAEPDTPPESGAVPENLSHVIFTSGSTGRPKGVMIRHSSVVTLLHWLRESVSDADRSAVLFSTSVSFDVSVAEVFGTLCWGGKLVLAENALELPALGEPVVHASMVPTAAAELLRSGGIPASVRTLSLGGEELPADLAAALYDLGTVETVRNLYGPTEDTTYSTCSVVERGAARVAIGRPVANTRAYVLGDALEPVPAGAAGELYLAGDGLARGYAGRPDLTAERFIPDPFSSQPGARMYRVRDRVRRRADGELDYLGRTDTQVKVRGFRIELGEVEAALRAHPEVREVAAVVREDVPGERRIVAYLVAADSPDAAARGQELRAWLGDRLPGYMVPAAFVLLDALPRTGSGKLDRRALPAPVAGSGDAYVAPRTPTEERIAAIWADVLRAPRVGVHDAFFDLGGHSLLATQVVSRVHRALGVELRVADVFQDPTVEALARRVDALLAAGAPADGADAIGRQARRGVTRSLAEASRPS